MSDPTHDNTPSLSSARGPRPRGFLLIVVAALAALAGVIAMGQWGMATSVARTGTTMVAQSKARAIADACLEQWLRYAKDGVDTTTWVDFAELLSPTLSSAPANTDYIPNPAATHCTAGVTYIPKNMSSASEPRQGLHRYCAYRIDGGACLFRFDDNSDDG
jgi:hypothetical protein